MSKGEIIIEKLSGQLFAKMMISGANNLYNNRQTVDELNVFPVPDGDTGTNMSLTSKAMAAALAENKSDLLTKTADTAANATLRGARGNSGVILSQFYRGIAKSLKGKSECDAKMLANALKDGSDTAYKAVMNPTEGTILTVAREAAEGAVRAAKRESDIAEVMAAAVERGNKALSKTPDILPALKQAGVVDAGGKGWMCILEGALEFLKTGNITESGVSYAEPSVSAPKQAEVSGNIKYSYCTEFIVEKKHPDVNVELFKSAIEKKGDCMLVIDDDEIVKVHIHTNHPGFILEKAILLGSMINIKIDNMKHQHQSLIKEAQTDYKKQEEKTSQPTGEPLKQFGFVAVCAGAGFADIFKDLGVDGVIEGGQTMNPSTDDILNAAMKTNAENIFVFPNNKNIILAANQAKELCARNIVVIPTTGVPQAVTALMSFNANASVRINEDNMNSAIKAVKTANVTYAVRDTEADGKCIKEGDILGIAGGKIEKVGNDAAQVCEELTKLLSDDETEFITVYYGSDVEKEKAQILAQKLENEYKDAEVLLKYGGQPLYYYVVAVE